MDSYNPLKTRNPRLLFEYYVEAHTRIPVPHVIHHNAETDGEGAHSPYIIMSKVDGSPLGSVWNDMGDSARDTILGQVVDILLEFSSHRFERIGALFKRKGLGKDAWYLKPLAFVTDPDDSSSQYAVSGMMYSSGTDYWIAYANAKIKMIYDEDFGSQTKAYDKIWGLEMKSWRHFFDFNPSKSTSPCSKITRGAKTLLC